MRNPSDYPNQETRTTLGDHDNPPIGGISDEARKELSRSPRFESVADERFPAKPEYERNMLIYGGLVGDRDDEPNMISRMKIRKLRSVIGQLLEAQASALYSGRMAMALIESCDALEFMDKLKELRLSSQRTMEECARLIACGEKEQR